MSARRTVLRHLAKSRPRNLVPARGTPLTGAIYGPRHRAGRGAYEGARRDIRELKSWLPRLLSPASDTVPDLPDLRARTLDLDRNDPISKGALDTSVEHVVGTGLTPVPSVDREVLGISEADASAWNRRALKVFQAVANTTKLDLADEHTFLQLQWLTLRSALGGGDAFCVRRFKERGGDLLGLKLQLFEAPRCSTPPGMIESARLIDGVEKDDDGRPVRYYFSSEYPNETLYLTVPTWTPVEAFGGLTGERQVLHIAERLRIGQPRGVPLLAPVIKQLKQMSRYADHELQAAVVSSLLTVLITSESAIDDGPGLEDLDDGSSSHFGPSLNDNEIQLAPGAVGRLDPGEKIETVNPSRPNAQFDPFMSAMAQLVGAGIGIPYELLIKRFNASYSASRASLLQAWRAFDRRQTWLVECFCQPVYEWVIAEAIDRGYLDAPGFHEDPFVRAAYLRAEWRGPTMGQIDPLKEVLAAERRVAAGFSTRAAESAALTGLDADQVHEQLVREKNRRVRDGLELPLLAAPSTPPGNAGELVRRETEDDTSEDGDPADGMDEPEEMVDLAAVAGPDSALVALLTGGGANG